MLPLALHIFGCLTSTDLAAIFALAAFVAAFLVFYVRRWAGE